MVTKSAATSHIRFLALILIVGLTVFNLVACGDDGKASPEWTEINPLTDYPDFTYQGLAPSCSAVQPGVRYGSGTTDVATFDPTFTFFVKNGAVNDEGKGTTSKLIIFFEDGGACWDSMNCLYAHTYVEDVTKVQLDAGPVPKWVGNGIFDTANPENPFKDWSIVYIPYCTGDIHTGAKDTEYPDIANQYGGGNVTIRHRGQVNFQAVLQWVKDNFDDARKAPAKILVTGSSAGAYGSIHNFPYIADAFPNAATYQLGDAGCGVEPIGGAPLVASLGGPNLDIRPIIKQNWNPVLPAITAFDGLDYNTLTLTDFYTTTAAAYPNSRFAQYTTILDQTQIFFYYLQGYSYTSYAPGNGDTYPMMASGDPTKLVLYAVTPTQWKSSLSTTILDFTHNPALAALASVANLFGYVAGDWKGKMATSNVTIATAASSNYRYYIANGTTHTINVTAKFYSEASGGAFYIDWLNAMLDPTSTDWVNRTQAF